MRHDVPNANPHEFRQVLTTALASVQAREAVTVVTATTFKLVTTAHLVAAQHVDQHHGRGHGNDAARVLQAEQDVALHGAAVRPVATERHAKVAPGMRRLVSSQITGSSTSLLDGAS